jgi:hypothetical protein
VQPRSAVHAVGPNRLTSRVCSDPQRGQRTVSGRRPNRTNTGPGRPGPAGPGGAMPCSASARRPDSVIQSVLQAGASTVRTIACG